MASKDPGRETVTWQMARGGPTPDMVPAVKQATGDLAHGIAGLLPAPAAPDAQLLLPHPDLFPTQSDGIPENGRNGLARHDDVVAWLDVANVP